jgi:D-sorbitol dehydrogenase (acceptor)
MRLKDKKALVIGGLGEIGTAIVAVLQAQGAQTCVSIFKRWDDNDAQIADKLHMDLCNTAQINSMIAAAVQKMGHIDILVNAAGVITYAPLVEIDDVEYNNLFDVNVRGTLFAMQAAAKHMIAAGIKGRMVNISSVAGMRGEAGLSLYCASKAAVISMTQSAALELIKHGIRVNCVVPGAVDTDMMRCLIKSRLLDQDIDDAMSNLGRIIPTGRLAEPSEIASCVAFLASDDSSYMVGESMVVSGGMYVG